MNDYTIAAQYTVESQAMLSVAFGHRNSDEVNVVMVEYSSGRYVFDELTEGQYALLWGAVQMHIQTAGVFRLGAIFNNVLRYYRGRLLD